MVRNTSIESYKALIADSDALGKRHKLILMELIEANNLWGPITANELYRKRLAKSILVQSNITTRLGELRDMGAVKECGKRICTVTGQTVLTWHYTLEKPIKVNRISKKDRIVLIKSHLNVMYADLADKPKSREDIKRLWIMIKEL